VFSQRTSSMIDAARRVLSTLKYFYNNYDLNDAVSSSGSYWSLDGDEWTRIITNIYASSLDAVTVIPIDEYEEEVQLFLDSGIKPFLAFKHLHRARNENDPRFKWIDATIAAELAIKEFFALKHPELNPMLVELPSPPLRTLYGKLLGEYDGIESPRKNQIDDGAKLRNKLVHRHEEQEIDPQKAVDYIQDVEIAIFHLLTLLYPDNPVIKRLYRSISIKLNR
jgi:hypothetical protein